MSKNMNNYVTFVSLDAIKKNSVASFGEYEDQDGNVRKIVSHSKMGEDIEYRFKFGHNKRFIQLPKNKVDIYGNNYVEFLRNHPLNADSPNPKKTPWFKELDSEKDADIANESYRLRNEAETKALNLKGKDLDEVAKVLGYTGKESVLLHKILSYASKNPTEFLETVNDANRGSIALFEAGVKSKVISRKGFRYEYQEVPLGNSKELAIIKIAEDKDLQKVLAEAIKKAGG